MNLGVAEKILSSHLVEGKPVPGQEVGLRIDQTLTQDATGTMVYLQFESIGLKKVAADPAVSYVDHNTVQDGFENADDHRYLQTVAARYGVFYSRAGNGICHQVHLERFSAPGRTLVGSDSHTPTCGASGMIAIGAGGIEVALAMAGLPFYVEYPRVIRVQLHGKLPAWSSAKDLILFLLKIFSTKGNTGIILEYAGEGLSSLSVPDRATVSNMGAETGVTTSVFPSDDVTYSFFRAQGRTASWKELLPDPAARYDRTVDVDLARIQPMAACPHSPDNVASVSEIRGRKISQVAIGSCTNSSYRDMMTVAGILKGNRVHPDVSLVIAPGSRQVLKMLADSGALSVFIESGARMLEPVCGFCIGNCQAPETEGVSLRTINRNFRGRSGTKSAEVYLVSPETAAVSAVRGEITDPRDSGTDPPVVSDPESFPVDDSMIIPPLPENRRERIVVRRGPNIGEPLQLEKLPDRMAGTVQIRLGDKVTTDDIMPAGSRLKYRSNIPRYAEFVFEQLDPGFSRRCLESRKQGRDSFIVGGSGYGQGSSREHAAICPRYLGVRAVLALSFERIHFANLVNFGILPLTLQPQDYEVIQQGDELELVGLKTAVRERKEFTLRDITRSRDIPVRLELSDRQRVILQEGGILNHARERLGR